MTTEPFILGRIRRGESVDHHETIRQTKDGRLIDISLTVSPIKNESGEIIGASKIARDISESKRAQERLKLLLREMDHRVKNLFSLAIGVLHLSGRSAETAKGVVETASARLTALARAHALTLSHSHADVVDGAKPHRLINGVKRFPALSNMAAIDLVRGTAAGLTGLMGVAKSEENCMPKEAHTKAAEHHENAAKSHRSAAEHHGKGDHAKGHEESTKAQGNAKTAREHSEAAHGKSQSHK
jgi:transcriptional regulator of acetoin/glycerol metabolism